MEIAFFDYEDELRSIIFAFEEKTEEGIRFAICNPRFEYTTVFNSLEMMSFKIYFEKLKNLKEGGSATDLKLENQGILMRNARFDQGDVIFELIIQRKEETGFTKTVSNIIFADDMIENLNEIVDK